MTGIIRCDSGRGPGPSASGSDGIGGAGPFGITPVWQYQQGHPTRKYCRDRLSCSRPLTRAGEGATVRDFSVDVIPG